MDNPPKTTTADEPRHPIQVVARRTGLSLDVIRAWERRYKVVAPHRSKAKRRLYSDADVRKLSLLHRATRAGRRISDLAGLDETEILALLTEDQSRKTIALTSGVNYAFDDSIAQHLDNCLSAIEQLNQAALERALNDASVDLSIPVLLEQIVSPLFKQIGKSWERGKARVGHEHFTTATVRTFLGNLISTANVSPSGPIMLVATPNGQNHEIGALMAAVIAASDGWRVSYLSPNIPARDLAAVARQQKPAVVILGITYPSDDEQLPRELRTLKKYLDDDVQIIVGGDAIDGYRLVLQEIGAKSFHNLKEFRDYLRKIRAPNR